MKLKLSLALLVLFLGSGVAGAICPSSIPCPIDGSNAIYTGDTWPNGKHVKWFRCPSGHTSSIVC